MEKKKGYLSEQAYHEIRNAILANEFRAGEKIGEKMLCEKLKMSRTPVRSALQMLASEGLVEIRDGAGTFVRTQSRKEIEDAYELRKYLELLAIQTSIEHFSDQELDELEAEFRRLQAKVEENALLSLDECRDADWELHDRIIQKSNNRYLGAVMNVIRVPLKRYQDLSVKYAMHTEVSILEHIEIIQAIRDRDLPRAEELLKQHIVY